jgi:hypothetical protein
MEGILAVLYKKHMYIYVAATIMALAHCEIVNGITPPSKPPSSYPILR